MNNMSHLTSLVIVTAALIGCGEKSASTQNNAAASSAQVAAAHRGAPMRKSGWWEFGPEDSKTPDQKLCISEATEAKLSAFDQITQETLLDYKCSTANFTRSGEGWAFETACDTGISASLGGGIVSSKGTIKGDIRTSYKVAITVTQAGQTVSGTITATWKGACPNGRNPGDLVKVDGDMLLLNILQSTAQQ